MARKSGWLVAGLAAAAVGLALARQHRRERAQVWAWKTQRRTALMALVTGASSGIGAAYAHVIAGEDYFVQTVILGKPRLWESCWQAKIGITAQIGRDWGVTIPDLAAFREYAAAVTTAVEAYAETLTPAELDRTVSFFGNPRPVSRVLATLVVHGSGHAGEIAALKGAMGLKGLPM